MTLQVLEWLRRVNKTHFKLSIEERMKPGTAHSSLITTQRHAYQQSQDFEAVKPVFNASEFKKSHFNFGFQKSSFETSNSGQEVVMNMPPNSAAKSNKFNKNDAKIQKYKERLVKLYGDIDHKTANKKLKYVTANDAYPIHDVSNALKMVQESKNKSNEFKKTNFSFGFHSRIPPKSSFNVKRRVNYHQHTKRLHKGSKVSFEKIIKNL